MPDLYMNRYLKRILALISVFALLLCSLGAVCFAEGTGTTAAAPAIPLKVAVEISPSKFSGPSSATVAITVTNITDTTLPGPVTVYYAASGLQMEEFGSPTLDAGRSQSATVTMDITKEMLDEGKVSFNVVYSMLDSDGQLVNKRTKFSKPITIETSTPDLQVVRTITPSLAGNGQKVSVIYDVTNLSGSEVTDIVIKEHKDISTRSGTIKKLASGESATYTFTITMAKKDKTSSPTVTYKAGGKTYSAGKIEAATIKYGVVSMTATLTADKKGGAAGDKVTLTLQISNKGKVDISDIFVTDKALGEVFSGIKVEAGKSTKLTRDITMTATQNYQFTVQGKDTAGNVVEATTGRTSLTMISDEQKLDVAVTASADRDTVYKLPGAVRFHVELTNNSTSELKDVAVKAAGTTVYTFPSVLPGETREFSKDLSVSMAGNFRFDVECENILKEKQTFSSNQVYIGYAAPTAVPTEVPVVTPAKPTYVPIPTRDTSPAAFNTQRTIYYVKLAVLIVALLLVATVAAGAVIRVLRKVKGDKYDHIDGGNYRDYDEAQDNGEEEAQDSSEEDEDDLSPSFDDYANAQREVVWSSKEDSEAEPTEQEENIEKDQDSDK